MQVPSAVWVVHQASIAMGSPAPGLLDGAAAQGDTPRHGSAAFAAEGPAKGVAGLPEEGRRETPLPSSDALDGISGADPACSSRSESLSGLAPVRDNTVARCHPPSLRRTCQPVFERPTSLRV